MGYWSGLDDHVDEFALTSRGSIIDIDHSFFQDNNTSQYVGFTTGINPVIWFPNSFSTEADNAILEVHKGGALPVGTTIVGFNRNTKVPVTDKPLLTSSVNIGQNITTTGILVYTKNLIGDVNKAIITNKFVAIVLEANTFYYIQWINNSGQNNKGFNITYSFADLEPFKVQLKQYHDA